MKNFIKLLCIFFVSSVYAKEYKVFSPIRALPNVDEYKDARRKKIDLLYGSTIKTLDIKCKFSENFECFQYIVKGVNKGDYCADKRLMRSYKSDKSVFKPISSMPTKTKRRKVKSPPDSKSICERLSGKFIRFSTPIKVNHVKGPKRGSDQQTFTNRSIFSFKVTSRPGHKDKCLLSMKAKGKDELRKPELIFETDSSNFIKPNQKLNIYGSEELTLDEYNPLPTKTKVVETDQQQSSSLEPEPETKPEPEKVLIPEIKETFCQKLSKQNPKVESYTKERVAYNSKGQPIIIGKLPSKWRIIPGEDLNDTKRCNLIRIDDQGKDIDDSQIEVDMTGAVSKDFSIKKPQLSEKINSALKRLEKSKLKDVVIQANDSLSSSEVKTSEIKEPCIGCEEKKFSYEQCKGNDFLSSKIRSIVSSEKIKDLNSAKVCIRAAHKVQSGKKFLSCFNGSNLHKNIRHCSNAEYVTYLHELIKDIADCVPDANIEELLPVIAQESGFFHNTYNNQKAAGLMQVTASLLNDYNRIKEFNINKSKECNDLKKDIDRNPLSSRLTTCERTSIPNGIKRSTYYAIVQLNRNKKFLKTLFSENNFKSYLNPNDYENIITDLSSLMHNKGEAAFKALVLDFFKNVLKEGSKLNELWGQGEFKQPMSRDVFMKYLSSYIYYTNHSNTSTIKKRIEFYDQYKVIQDKLDAIYEKFKTEFAQIEKYETKIRGNRPRLRKVKRLLEEKPRSKDLKREKEVLEKRISDLKLKIKKISEKIPLDIVDNYKKSIEKKRQEFLVLYSTYCTKRRKLCDKSNWSTTLKKRIHSMRDFEGGNFYFGKLCNQARMQYIAQEDFGKDVTCGKAELPKGFVEKLLEFGNGKIKCDHYTLSGFAKKTLGKSYPTTKDQQ